MQITIPIQATLTVTLTAGNMTIDNLQGQLTVTLGSGTIHVTHFTPTGTSAITTGSGTIDVTFTPLAACQLTAQTAFGSIVSRYPSIQPLRNGMQSHASGTLGSPKNTSVQLKVTDGSISLGPVK